MRFLSIYKSAERSTPLTPEEMAIWAKLAEEGMKARFFSLARAVCQPRSARGFAALETA